MKQEEFEKLYQSVKERTCYEDFNFVNGYVVGVVCADVSDTSGNERSFTSAQLRCKWQVLL